MAQADSEVRVRIPRFLSLSPFIMAKAMKKAVEEAPPMKKGMRRAMKAMKAVSVNAKAMKAMKAMKVVSVSAKAMKAMKAMKVVSVNAKAMKAMKAMKTVSVNAKAMKAMKAMK